MEMEDDPGAKVQQYVPTVPAVQRDLQLNHIWNLGDNPPPL